MREVTYPDAPDIDPMPEEVRALYDHHIHCDNLAVRWNPYNMVVQCHHCGEIFVPLGSLAAKIDAEKE